MTGPEHYREAERLLLSCQVTPATDRDPAIYPEYPATEDGVNTIGNALAAARVHATLALTAATAYPAVKDYCGDEASEPRGWAQVTS